MNSYNFSNTILTNGHSHFVLLGNDEKKLEWRNENKFKICFIERLIKCKKNLFIYECKSVGVIFDNIPNCIDECLMFIKNNWPHIIIEDSEF